MKRAAFVFSPAITIHARNSKPVSRDYMSRADKLAEREERPRIKSARPALEPIAVFIPPCEGKAAERKSAFAVAAVAV
jgi:hypothetical protein